MKLCPSCENKLGSRLGCHFCGGVGYLLSDSEKPTRAQINELAARVSRLESEINRVYDRLTFLGEHVEALLFMEDE